MIERILPDHSDSLPAGLVFHCEACKLVVPAEAPRPEGGDCLAIAQHRLAWFNPSESIKGQHTMAAAAWELIYHRELKDPDAPAELRDYRHLFKHEPLRHFRESHARQALTEEQVAQGRSNRRDAWAYAEPGAQTPESKPVVTVSHFLSVRRRATEAAAREAAGH